MPTEQTYLQENVIRTVWTAPLKSEELSDCFTQLAKWLDSATHTTHILFDISGAGSIPTQAPFLFIRAEITKRPNMGRIAVVGTNPIAQILAQMAVKMTSQHILFFATEADAMAYLNSDI